MIYIRLVLFGLKGYNCFILHETNYILFVYLTLELIKRTQLISLLTPTILYHLNSSDPDKTPSNSASRYYASCLTLGQSFY